MSDKPQVIYVGDPMCSWCWGIAPVVEHVSRRDDITLRVVVGGLRPGPSAEPLDDRMRAMLSEHWGKVEEVSGQPFDLSGLDRENWVYDTELPAIAVTTMRHLAEAETLRFFTELQRAFYADRVDITDIEVYPPLLAGYDVAPDEFMKAMRSDEGRTRAWEDFAESRELGVLGFPTILLQHGDSTQVLSRGYATSQHFDDQLAYWLEGKLPDTADVGTCSIEEGTC